MPNKVMPLKNCGLSSSFTFKVPNWYIFSYNIAIVDVYVISAPTKGSSIGLLWLLPSLYHWIGKDMLGLLLPITCQSPIPICSTQRPFPISLYNNLSFFPFLLKTQSQIWRKPSRFLVVFLEKNNGCAKIPSWGKLKEKQMWFNK